MSAPTRAFSTAFDPEAFDVEMFEEVTPSAETWTDKTKEAEIWTERTKEAEAWTDQ